MDRDIGLEDFDFVVVNPKKGSGYYSFKEDNYEICLDKEKQNWEVYVCNDRQEVLECKGFSTKEKALGQVNKTRKKLTPGLM